MELVAKAKTSNDFGIRARFPWTGSDQHSPWTERVTKASEISFVTDHLFPILLGTTPLIYRIENPYLWARYMLSFEELRANSTCSVSEHHVIHATSMSNALNIADMNFDWRRVNRARFGKGVSFSPNAGYAKKYATGKDVYIIAGIPIGRKTWGSYSTTIPSNDCDTTGDSRGNVYVKYYDSDFYPYYIVKPNVLSILSSPYFFL